MAINYTNHGKYFIFVFFSMFFILGFYFSDSHAQVFSSGSFESHDLSNGTTVWTSDLSVLTNKTVDFDKPYIFNDNGDSYTITSGLGTYVYDKQSCGIKLYKPETQISDNSTVVNSISFTLQQTDDKNATSYSSSSLNSESCVTTNTDDGKILTITATRQNSDGVWTIQYSINGVEPMKYSSKFVSKLNAPHYYVVTESQDGIPSTIVFGFSNSTQNEMGYELGSNTQLITDSLSKSDGISYDGSGFYDLLDAKKYLHKSELIIHSDHTQQIYYDFMSANPIANGTNFSFDPAIGVGSLNGNVVSFGLNGLNFDSEINSVNLNFTVIGNHAGKQCTVRLLDDVLTENSISDSFSCSGFHSVNLNSIGDNALENNLLYKPTWSFGVKDSDSVVVPINSPQIKVQYTKHTYYANIINGKVSEIIVADKQFINKLNGTWIETKTDGSIRGKSGNIGDTYNATLDKFIPPKPYPSWVLNNTSYWIPPVPYPSDGKQYHWNETLGNWN